MKSVSTLLSLFARKISLSVSVWGIRVTVLLAFLYGQHICEHHRGIQTQCTLGALYMKCHTHALCRWRSHAHDRCIMQICRDYTGHSIVRRVVLGNEIIYLISFHTFYLLSSRYRYRQRINIVCESSRFLNTLQI